MKNKRDKIVDISKLLLQEINKYRNVYIYGAGNISQVFYRCLQRKVGGFVVTADWTQSEVCNLPVYQLSDLRVPAEDTLFIIAVMDRHVADIQASLHAAGYTHILNYSFESMAWSHLREEYLQHYFHNQNYVPLTSLSAVHDTTQHGADIRLYMVQSIYDHPLSEPLPADERLIPLQVGAALTEQRIAALCDNTGENISSRNRQYCELTATYWIWKNAAADWVGICHYRRHFDFGDKTLADIPSLGIDAVLTVPIINFPDVESVYIRDHEQEDWQLMLTVLQERHPDYYRTAQTVFHDICYYPYNMVLARREVFAAYSEWLFDILFEVERRNQTQHQTNYQGRYLGFLAERLTALFFMHNAGKYRIVHTYKHYYK